MEIVFAFMLIIIPLVPYFVNNIYSDFVEGLLWSIFFIYIVCKLVGNHNIRFKIIDIFCVVFAFICIDYHLSSEIAETSVYKDLIRILALWFIAHQSIVSNKRFVYVLIVTGCVHCLLSVEQTVVAVGIPMRGIMNNSGIWGIYIAILLPLSFGEFLFSKNLYCRFVLFVVSLLFLAMIILSQSRSAIVAVILSCSYLMVKHKPYLKLFIHSICIRIVVLIVFVLLGIVLYCIRPDSIKGRLLVYVTAVNMISEKPVIGYGYNGFKRFYLDYQSRYFQNHPCSIFEKYADDTEVCFNEFLQILVEYGFVGLFFIAFFLFSIFYSFEVNENDKTFCILKSSLLSLIITSLFSYPLRREETLLMVIILIGSLLAYTKEYTLRCHKMIILIYMFAGSLFYINFCRYMIIQNKGCALWEEARGESNKVEKRLRAYREASKYLGTDISFLNDYSIILYEENYYNDAICVLKRLLTFKSKYDVYMILGDCYEKLGNTNKAEYCYRQAQYMIPNRFMPLYKLMLLYKQTSQKVRLLQVATEICDKKIKIPSYVIEKIKIEANGILKE